MISLYFFFVKSYLRFGLWREEILYENKAENLREVLLNKILNTIIKIIGRIREFFNVWGPGMPFVMKGFRVVHSIKRGYLLSFLIFNSFLLVILIMKYGLWHIVIESKLIFGFRKNYSVFEFILVFSGFFAYYIYGLFDLELRTKEIDPFKQIFYQVFSVMSFCLGANVYGTVFFFNILSDQSGIRAVII